MQNSDLNVARGRFYESFASAFCLLDSAEYQRLAKQFDLLSKYALNDEQERALCTLASVSYERFKLEQNAIFYDFSLGNVPLSASFYDEGADNGAMRVLAAQILHQSRFRLNAGASEDEFGVLFGLCACSLGCGDESTARQVFERILNSVIDEFIDKISHKQGSEFYTALGVAMGVFVELERLLLGLKPPEHTYSKADIALAKKPYTPKMPTQFSKINLEEVTQFKGMD